MTRRFPFPPRPDGTEKRHQKKSGHFPHEFLDTLIETPEFHDPYSDLSLFLSKKMKQMAHHCSNPNKWSIELQEELFGRIAPEFQEKFPKYRLGNSAIKKTWEKRHAFVTQIEGQKEAMTEEGTLNIPFFIKENLKSAEKCHRSCHLHPYNYAHQLAMKMSECIAVVDGIRPKIDQLTKTIWSMQRHLIPELTPSQMKSPYDENERIDKLIVKVAIEVTAQKRQLTHSELAFYVERRLLKLKQVTEAYSPRMIEKILEALFSEMSDSQSHRMEKLLESLPYKDAKCFQRELANQLIDSPLSSKEEVIGETLAFFQKAALALEKLDIEELDRKIQHWTLQGDLVLRWLRLDHSSALFQETYALWRKDPHVTLHAIVSSFLDKYPALINFADEVEWRTLLQMKYIWYTQAFNDTTPTFDRFILWQKRILKEHRLGPNELLTKIERRAKEALPLIPFNRARASTLLVTEKQQ